MSLLFIRYNNGHNTSIETCCFKSSLLYTFYYSAYTPSINQQQQQTETLSDEATVSIIIIISYNL